MVVTPPRHRTVFGTNKTCSRMLCFARSSQYEIFPQSLITADFFTSVNVPAILMNVLEDCIILLILAAWVLFNFYLE